MELQYGPIRRLLERVRSRYRALEVLRAVIRAALSLSAVVVFALAVQTLVAVATQSPVMLVAVGVLAVLSAAAALVWALRPLRTGHSDRRLARFVEERVPSLDDRLVTAVDLVTSGTQASGRRLAEALLKDASRSVEAVDIDHVVPAATVRSRTLQASAATIALVVLAFLARGSMRQSLDAAALTLFPARVALEVSPGDARLKEGAMLSVEARLVGTTAPVSARLEIEDGSAWRPSEMIAQGAGRFRSTVSQVARGFRYRVAAGTLLSPVYRVRVVPPPRVARIDIDYSYPSSLGVPSRTETDTGDVYAPAGTEARLHVHTEQPVARATLSLGSGRSVPLTRQSATEFIASLTVSEDSSYRIALVDPEGLSNDAGGEYFIRVVTDRPPEIHVSKPASDRQVTALEEVDIEAQADDDYGLDRVELVYAVRGEAERIVPLAIERRTTMATVRHTLFLEDLGVRPGDFVSYYVRARDVTRGGQARSNEGRSDIFFLEIRPFEQEFSLAESQSMAGAGYNGSIDDLVNAQKQVVVATWKIDRRTQAMKGARPAEDIRAIGRSESDLLTRVEEVASSLRESTMRDPRQRLGRAGDSSMPEEQAMTKAVDAMLRAVAALNALKTVAALPPEMQGLNALLEAQALVKKRQISRQQTAQGGPGNNNRNYDVSTLFDKELQRLQETNYEARQSNGGSQPGDSIADKLKALARRQDELLRRQQQLENLTEEQRKRELEKLTREQAELKQQAEELTKSAAKNGSSPNATSQLRDITRDMDGATNDLRRQDAASSQSRGRQALDKLQRLSRAGSERDAKQQGQNGRLEDALAKARELQQKFDSLTRELQQLQGSGRRQTADRERLQQEAARQLQQTRDLIEQLRREDPSLTSGGPGFTYEGQGMTFSAPGTEAFKRDVSRWQSLRDQATRALDRVSSNVAQRLGQKSGSAERASSGLDDHAPASYRAQVDAYFKAIAGKKAQ
jgi:hypothetical protein